MLYRNSSRYPSTSFPASTKRRSAADQTNAIGCCQVDMNAATGRVPDNGFDNPSSLPLLLIAVKEVGDYKLMSETGGCFGSGLDSDTVAATTADFEHVSALDPNMSSTARYSPTYVDADIAYANPIVVQQLVSVDGDGQHHHAPAEGVQTQQLSATQATFESLERVVATRYLLAAQDGANADENDGNVLQLVDQTSGVSYVSTQEYLVERCLSDDQHLLDALEPDSLLHSAELLTLDDSTLKSQLQDIGIGPHHATLAFESATSAAAAELIKLEEAVKGDAGLGGVLIKLESGPSKVPPPPHIPEASSPSQYFSILESREGKGVFATKIIPKGTKLGPIEGLLVQDDENEDDNSLKLYIESNGIRNRIDISNQQISNWTSFIRKARYSQEENLHVVQEGMCLYYVAITNIFPKEELLVGYSNAYLVKYGISLLTQKEDTISPLDCDKIVVLNIDSSKKIDDEKMTVRRKDAKRVEDNKVIMECNICEALFCYADDSALLDHLNLHNLPVDPNWREKFTITSYVCGKCETILESEAALKCHELCHQVQIDDTVRNKHENVTEDIKTNGSKSKSAGYKCPICNKVFAFLERYQRHTLVHGSEESKPFKCETCGKRFLNNSALSGHLKTHNKDKKMFECPICKETFDHVIHFKMHVSKHRHNDKYTCPHCPKIFKEYSVIRKHIRAFHCDRKHNCPHCDKPFPTLDKLRMHSLRHSDHREFLCADCGKQFKRKDKLKEHAKRMHADERENATPKNVKSGLHNGKKFMPKVQPTDYHRFIYKCHFCLVGFKRRGMLVNHLAKRHPDVSLDLVPELNLPILRTTRDYYCQYCDKVYKSSSKRKAHILKNHPGQALPMSNRKRGSFPDMAGLPNPTFSQTVGSVTTHPQACQWCHKQYASKAKLLQHQRKKHSSLLLQGRERGGSAAGSGCENSNEGDDGEHEEATALQSLPSNTKDVSDDSKNFKREFQVSDEFLTEMVALTSDVREDEDYYRLVTVPSGNLTSQADLNCAADSRLFHLLTSGGNGGLLPPSR